MLTNTVEVATMTKTRFTAVFYILAHTFDLFWVIGSLCKTIRHEHIQHVGIGEAHSLVTAHLPLLQLVRHFRLVEAQHHVTSLCPFQVKIQQQVVRRVEPHHTVNAHTGIIGRNILHVPDILSIDHQL